MYSFLSETTDDEDCDPRIGREVDPGEVMQRWDGRSDIELVKCRAVERLIYRRSDVQ